MQELDVGQGRTTESSEAETERPDLGLDRENPKWREVLTMTKEPAQLGRGPVVDPLRHSLLPAGLHWCPEMHCLQVKQLCCLTTVGPNQERRPKAIHSLRRLIS